MDVLSAIGLGLEVNTTRNIPVDICQLTDTLMGKREYHLLHAVVVSVHSSREHGYIEDEFLSGGTEDCMRKLS